MPAGAPVSQPRHGRASAGNRQVSKAPTDHGPDRLTFSGQVTERSHMSQPVAPVEIRPRPDRILDARRDP